MTVVLRGQPLSLRSHRSDHYVRGSLLEVEEDSQHEFKSCVNAQDPTQKIVTLTVKYVNAFLNTNGGCILHGVDDSGRVAGLALDRKQRDHLRLRIDNALTNFKPQVDPDLVDVRFVPVFESEEAAGDEERRLDPCGFVVEVAALRGRAPVYFTASRGKGAKAFVRMSGSTVEMSEEVFEERKSLGRVVERRAATAETAARAAIGREAELAQIAAFIEQRTAEAPMLAVVVLLHGQPLVGKSCLAQQLLVEHSQRYPDAHFCVDLKSTPDPLDAMLSVLRVVHPTAPCGDSPGEIKGLYESCFVGKRCVVLAENASQQAQVRALIPSHAAACLFVVTSRKDLGLDATLDGALSIRLGSLSPEDSVRLLRSSAPGVFPDDGAQSADAERIVALCGCMPLAIRVVSGMLRQRRATPADVVRQLGAAGSARLGELVAPYVDLDTSEDGGQLAQHAFALGLFPASFDGAAACAVFGQEYDDGQSSLAELHEESLVDFDPLTARFYQCDPVRAYCQQHLLQRPADELRQWRARFVAHFADVARAASKCPEICAAEHHNFAAAVQYSKEIDDKALRARLLKSLEPLAQVLQAVRHEGRAPMPRSEPATPKPPNGTDAPGEAAAPRSAPGTPPQHEAAKAKRRAAQRGGAEPDGNGGQQHKRPRMEQQ
eukprot:m51a1_g1172 putative nb-arc domain containing protein (661) ;mRNA; r:375694-377922